MSLIILPTIKQQFERHYFEAISREMRRLQLSMPVRFDLAKERYEAEHGHRLPFSYVTFCRHYYDRSVNVVG